MSDSLRSIVKRTPGGARAIYEPRVRREATALRRATGLSQRRLADALDCDRSSVEDYERGAARIPGWYLRAVEDLALNDVKRGTGT